MIITKQDNHYLVGLLPRCRVRAEQCLGMIALAPEVVRRMNAAMTGAYRAVIDDGVQGQAPFTADHYLAFRDLFQSIESLGANAGIMAALHALQVRSVGVLTPQLPTPEAGGLDPMAAALRYIVRPLAPQIRAMFAQINDDAPIIPDTLGALADEDLIDENRPEIMTSIVPIGAIRLMHGILQQMAGPGTSDTLARAIDAACVTPLEVR